MSWVMSGLKWLSVSIISVTLFNVTIYTNKNPEEAGKKPGEAQPAVVSPTPAKRESAVGTPRQGAAAKPSGAALGTPLAAERRLPDPQRVEDGRSYGAPVSKPINGFIGQRVDPTERSYPAPASSVEGLIGLPVR